MSQQWREVREIVLARDNHRCRECGQHCGKGDADVHHLIPRATGGTDEPANLITLCDGCHAARHPNLQGTLARRSIEQWGLRLAKWLDREGDTTNLDESLGVALRMLGVERLRTAQLEVVLAALRGESLLFVSATGSGKSLCFQLPTLMSRGCAFVISPLKALMNQQVSSLSQHKIPATFINGDLAPHDKEIRYKWLSDNAIKFLYCTPERFDSAIVRRTEVEEITRARPSFLVIDEAHCIDRWGKDFRPNYGRLGAVRNALGRPPILAFTATAGRASQQRILQSLGIPGARVIVTGVDRPNIALARLEMDSAYDRFGLLADLLRRMPTGRAMVFVPTVKIGEHVQQRMRSMGRDIPFFHSGVGTANERDTLLGRFTGRIEPALDVVICTSAFGMGLDLPNVRMVVHWQHPASIEDYLQEFGRAGRDGAPSVAILFTRDNDAELLNWMAEQTVKESQLDDGDKSEAFQFRSDSIAEMHEHARRRNKCFRRAIVQYFGDTQSMHSKSLAIRILEWVFSRSSKVKRAPGCCDRCDQVGLNNVVDWAARIWGLEDQRGLDVPGFRAANEVQS